MPSHTMDFSPHKYFIIDEQIHSMLLLSCQIFLIGETKKKEKDSNMVVQKIFLQGPLLQKCLRIQLVL